MDKKGESSQLIDKHIGLKKHVAAIHSGSKLTLLQRKIANALLFNAYEALLDEDEHSIHVSELCTLIGYKSNDYSLVKRSLKSLLATVVEWNLIEQDKNGTSEVWNASSIISDASIRGPICTYSYSKRMRELLYHPEMYGRLNMQTMSLFKSTYSLALYENCTRYKNVKQTPWIDLELFRKLMGVETTKYRQFRDLKRRVIDKAISEVNEFTDLTLSLETAKANRNVTKIKFLIKPQAVRQNVNVVEPTNDGLTKTLVTDFGLTPQQAKYTLENHDASYVLDKIEIIKRSESYHAGAIKNMASYLMSALNKDYQAPKSSKQHVIEKMKSEKDHKVQKSKYHTFVKQTILTRFKASTLANEAKFAKKFEQFIEGTLYQNLFEKDGYQNPLIGDQLYSFLKKNHRELFKEILSFEEFIVQPQNEVIK